MATDPAKSPKLTKQERRKVHQEACKKAPCHSALKYPACVFCPWENKKPL